MVALIGLVVGVLVLFSIGYIGYSRYLAQFVGLDEDAETPAHKYEDGQEYVPAKKPVLLGHHFSSIAGGAPIVGPITAGLLWGWLPAVLWIAIGNPLMGAVHDFVSLSGSLRHEGRSIGSIIGEYVGEESKDLLLWFAFLTIILVVAVFAYVVGLVFQEFPSAATASMLYIALALVFGVYLYQFDLPFIPGTVLFVALTFASVFVGLRFPIQLSQTQWIPIVLVYSFIASVLPVWTLLQPRDYLSSFLLYAGVGGALVAIIVGTVLGSANEALVTNIPAFTGFGGNSTLGASSPLFPMLFVTIACGTISGFHALVSSGTTAKQLNRETDARLIGYGGMLGEGLLATVALSAVAVVGVTAADATGGVGLALPKFAGGGGVILSSLGIPASFGAPFMALVMVSFLLTSTDTALRLGRYLFEEIVGTPETKTQKVASNRYANSVVQCLVAYVLIASGTWTPLWQLFGSANQLLAALALLTATVWLANWDDGKQLVSTGVPMVLMSVVTVCALVYLEFYQNLYQGLILGNAETAAWSLALQIVIGTILLVLALALFRQGLGNIRDVRGQDVTAADGGTDQ
ncbi:carbon starvation protein A [Halococcus dombrowskii]|uniref:Carbon starvation protein A n=1 Tax=Halococcus dombrowskii TaxID=179637 RepID=A0AAV3SCD6_HALDO|nr:carbon starvation protein A [Halococcus dombrowskii]UOO94368.1 carbon starvation protein A [Halococcus dombrowskii]